MLENERGTEEVLQQFSALSSACREAALLYTRLRMRELLSSELESDEAVERFLRRVDAILSRAKRLG